MQLNYMIWDDGSPDFGVNVAGPSSVLNYSRALEDIWGAWRRYIPSPELEVVVIIAWSIQAQTCHLEFIYIAVVLVPEFCNF